MQMSIERFRETHKLIWDIVLANVDEIKRGEMSISSLKLLGIRVAHSIGLLDKDEMELIIEQHSCLLCASCTLCADCILGDCQGGNSLYVRANRGDASAMKEIRDAVDKQPFADLSIIDLHEWEERKMQMSIERFRDVHKLIWNTVIGHASEVNSRETSVYFLKQVGIETAYTKGMIDFDEAIVILRNNRCLLCAACEHCELCPLGNCNEQASVYKRACHGDVNAMIEIRDIVDKKPFAKLSVVIIYERC